MERTKKDWEEIIGHHIRNDTYLVLERMQKGEQYDAIIEDLSNHREENNIGSKGSLVKLETIKTYLALIDDGLDQESIKRTRRNYDNITGYGVYGIFVDDELIYIGQTKNFKERFKSHNSNFHVSDKALYKKMRMEKEAGKQVSIKPLINVEELDIKGSLKRRDLEAMELALISLYKPKYNYEGIVKPYCFTDYDYK